MKNNVKYLFYATAILLLASSFVTQSAPSETSLNGEENSSAIPYGGAFVLFAGKFGGEITRQEMENQTELKVDGCARGARIFDVTLSVKKNGKTSTFTTTSNVLTADMRNALKSLSKGDEFEFRNTKAYLNGSNDVVNVQGEKFVVV